MGYKVLTVTLFLCLMKRVHVRAQCLKPHFEGNVVLSDKDISTNDFPSGSQVTFMCINGHVPVVGGSSKSVTCNGNKWTELALSCTRKSCGSLEDISNGRYIIPNGILFGDSVTGVCNTGYTNMIFGPNQRTCRVDGWDGRAPYCEAVKCPSPHVIDNGHFDGQEDTDRQYEYGEGVSYKCNPGSDLIGTAVISCSDGGTFQPEPPKCIVVSCPVPNVPNASRIGGKSPPYGLNNFIQYKCSTGYDMIGEDSVRCLANGWSPEPPRCIGYCEKPVFKEEYVTISNAADITQKYHEGTNVTFKCNSGYKAEDLKASNMIKCENKQWTPLDLKCKEVYCEPPAFGGNVTISKPYDTMTKFLNGSNVKFECKSGYEPNDSEASKLVTCVDTQWTALRLRCKGVYCEAPAFGGNVTISKPFDTMTKFLTGSNVKFECKSGYEPVDSEASKLVTCVDTQWTALRLRCKGYCRPPMFQGHVIAKQLNSINKFLDGSRLEFECESGYKPEDSIASKFITCKDTNWTKLQLTCKEDSIPAPPSGEPRSLLWILWTFLGLIGIGIVAGIGYCFYKKNSKHEYSHKVATRNEDRDLPL